MLFGIIAASGLVGVAIGVVLVRFSGTRGLTIFCIALALAGAGSWVWADAQPGLDGLLAAAFALMVALPLLVGSILGALALRFRNGGTDDTK